MSNDNKINKKSWTTEEDAKLLKLIEELGVSGSWTLISSRMGDRSGKQCRERYHNHLKSDINKSAFTKEEDDLVNELQLKFGNQWAKISKYFNGRSDNAVKNRWHIINRSKPTEPVVNKKPIIPMLALNFNAPTPMNNLCANMDLLNMYHSHCEHAHEPTLSSRSFVPSSGRRSARSESTLAWRCTVPGSDSEYDSDSWMDELLSTSYSNTSDEDWSSGADDDCADDVSVNSNIFDMLTITPRVDCDSVVGPAQIVYDAFSEAALTQREDPKEDEFNQDIFNEEGDCFDFDVTDSDILTLDMLEGFIASAKPSPALKKLVNSHPRLTPRSPAFPVMIKRQRGVQPGGSPCIRM